MNLHITFEALKFYKLKSERTIQRWFILLYLVNVSIWFLPFADHDFTALFQAVNQIAEGQSAVLSLTSGNWVFIGLTLLVQLFNMFFIFSYAALFIAERSKDNNPIRLDQYAHAWPRLILLLILLIVPAMLTAFLFMIPLLVFVVMMYFMPLNLILDKSSLTEAMQASFRQTRGARLMIFIQVLFLSILLSFPESLILGFFSESLWASVLIQSFFRVFMVLTQGRMMGIFYFYIVKKDPIVITSNPNDQSRDK